MHELLGALGDVTLLLLHWLPSEKSRRLFLIEILIPIYIRLIIKPILQ